MKNFTVFIGALLMLFGAGTMFFFLTIPDPSAIKGCMTTSMYKVKLCPGSAQYTPLKNISKMLVDAIVISEDAAFYSHGGFDWDEINNSFQKNISAFRFSRGGSTISQQLAKNVFLDKEKSLFRKIREAYLAHEIEQILTKNQILERYLNVIEFAPKVFGVKQASHHYFGKDPSQLHFLEAAFLAYLLPNPKLYSQVYNNGRLTPFAKKRILDISHKLFLFKKISASQFLAAKLYVDNFPWRNLDGSAIAALTDTHISEPTATQLDEIQKVTEPIEEDDSYQEEVEQDFE